MKSLVRLLGLVFIVIGIVTLTYQGITYTTRENATVISDLQVATSNQKMIYLAPVLGGLFFVAGVILVVFGRNERLK